MFNSPPNMLTPAECARKWSSSNDLPFTCFVLPWLDSLDVLVDYSSVEDKNTRMVHKEWFWFFGYSNGSSATHWGCDMFVNINEASSHKGTVIVREDQSKFLVWNFRTFFIFPSLKRQLRFATSAAFPKYQKENNYYVADDVVYEQRGKSEDHLQDENLRDFITKCAEKSGYMFHTFCVPATGELVSELVDTLVESEPFKYRRI